MGAGHIAIKCLRAVARVGCAAWLLVGGTHALSQSHPDANANANAQRITLGSSATGRVAKSPVADVSNAFETLRSKVRSSDTLRVIVGIKVPFAPEGQLPPNVGANQRNEIAQTQSMVESRLPRFAQTRAHRFTSLPFMALEVDREQLEALGDMEEVTSVQEDQLRTPMLDTSVPFIRANENWASGYTGSNWAVAVLDEGIQNTHPFLSGRIVSEACYSSHFPSWNLYSLCPNYATSSVESGSASNCLRPGDNYLWACNHGTHVAGISSGSGSTGGVSYSGVAKGSPIISIQVFTWINNSSSVGAFDSDIIKGLERVYALRSTYNIAAVNMSLGGGAYSNQATCDTDNVSTKAAIDQLRSVGIATIIAAGNNGYTSALSSPGCISSAITVGATLNNSNSVASYSNSAGFVDLLAPGSSILSSVPINGYASYNGTSMATPHVAGCWSVLKSAKPSATPGDIETALKSTGVPVTDSKSGVTTPRIDCKAAQDFLLATVTVNHALSVGIAGSGSGTVTSTPAGISCGSVCSGSFVQGTSVTLTATPVPGDSFAGWSGACSGTGICTVSMSEAKSVTASFQAGVPALIAQALSGNSGSTREYSFPVPPGATNLRIEMTAAPGSTGDADLYVRFGAPPTLSSYDCRPYLYGSNETCTVASPSAGTYYVMVVAFNSYTNVNLLAAYDFNCTSTTITLSGTVTSTVNHYTCAPIVSDGGVTLTGTANVQLTSEDYIRFSQGFRVEPGARLKATAN